MQRLLLAVLLLAWSKIAFAGAIEDARAAYKGATTAYALGDYVEAAKQYERAFQLTEDAAVLYNAAQAHRAAGNKTRALQLYQSYLRVFGDRVDNYAEVQKHIATLKAAIEKEARAQSEPPTDPKTVNRPNLAAVSPSVPSAAVERAAPSAAVERAARPRHSQRWLAGVLVGVAVAVGLSVGLGVGIGVQPSDPHPSFGSAKVQ